jgi:hypothetical protein
VSSAPSRRRLGGMRVSRRHGALKCRASRAPGVSRAGPSGDDTGRPAGSRDRLPLGPEPIAGLGPGARDGPARLRGPLPRLEARSAATDVPVRPGLARETDRLAASMEAHLRSRLMSLRSEPSWRRPPRACTRGVVPAEAARGAARGKRAMAPIASPRTPASTHPTPGSVRRHGSAGGGANTARRRGSNPRISAVTTSHCSRRRSVASRRCGGRRGSAAWSHARPRRPNRAVAPSSRSPALARVAGMRFLRRGRSRVRIIRGRGRSR